MDIMYQRIFAELHTQKKSQKALAEFLGLKQQAITSWRAGRNSSYKKYIYGIADFLDVSVEYLKGETDVKEKPPVIDGGLMAANTVRIAGRDGSYVEKKLSDEQVDLIRRMVEQLPDYTD